jgi:hypothetical protein
MIAERSLASGAPAIYDVVIMRTIVDLPPELLTHLGRVSKRERISRAEVIRRAVAQYIRAWPSPDAADEAFGIWQHRAMTGLGYEDRVRQEWVRREGPR